MRNPDLDLIKHVKQGLRGRYGKLYEVGTRTKPAGLGDLGFFYSETSFAVDSLYFERAKIIRLTAD